MTDSGNAIDECVLHHAVNDLLDLQLAGCLQIGAGTTDLGAHRAELIREETYGFRSADIDAEYVHEMLPMLFSTSTLVGACAIEAPASVCG